jgi:hypothetical protein
MRKRSIDISNGRSRMYHTTFFYHGNMIVYLIVVYEYDDILVFLIDDIIIININFVVKS